MKKLITLRVDSDDYEMIVETLRLRRKQIHWSTDINKELVIQEFDSLIEKIESPSLSDL